VRLRGDHAVVGEGGTRFQRPTHWVRLPCIGPVLDAARLGIFQPIGAERESPADEGCEMVAVTVALVWRLVIAGASSRQAGQSEVSLTSPSTPVHAGSAN